MLELFCERTAARTAILAVRAGRRTAVVALAGACAIGAAGCSDADAGGQRGGMLLEGPGPGGFSLAEDVGARFTNGAVVLTNRGDEPVRIVSVEPELTGDGLRFLGALVAGPERALGSAQRLDAWPPAELSGEARSLQEAVLQPADDPAGGSELLLGFEVVASGRSTLRAVHVTYRHGDREHTATYPSTMAVCTDVAPEACEPEYGDFPPPTS